MKNMLITQKKEEVSSYPSEKKDEKKKRNLKKEERQCERWIREREVGREKMQIQLNFDNWLLSLSTQ